MSSEVIDLHLAAQECVAKADSSVTTSLGEMRALYRRCCDRLADGEEQLRRVEMAQGVDLADVSHAELKAEWGLKQAIEVLADPHQEPRLQSLHDLAEKLHSLKTLSSNEERIRIFRTLIDTLRSKAQDLALRSAGTQVDASLYTEPCLPTVELLQDYMNERRPHNETTQLSHEVDLGIERVTKLCNDTDAEEARWTSGVLLKQRLESGGEGGGGPRKGMHTAIQRHRWLAERYEDIFEAFSKVLKLLRSKASILSALIDTNSCYKPRAEAVKQAAVEALDTQTLHVHAVTHTCKDDIVCVQDRIEASRTTGDEAEQLFDEWKRGSDERLKINAGQQDKCWERLFTVEEDLSRLGEERRTEIKTRVARVVEETVRKLSLQKLVARAEAHIGLLQNQLANNEVALSLIEFVQDTVVRGTDKGVRAQRKGAKHQLHELRTEVHRKELELFRSLHVKAGDLIQRNQLYVARLDDGMGASWQLRTLYSDTKRELLDQVDCLRELQRVEALAFAPTEAALRAANVAFVHPSAEEAGEAMKERRRTFAQQGLRSRMECEAARLEFALSHTTSGTKGVEGEVRSAVEAVGKGAAGVLSSPADTVERDLDRVVLDATASSSATIAARRVLGGTPSSRALSAAAQSADKGEDLTPPPPTQPRTLNPSPPSKPRSGARKGSKGGASSGVEV